MLASEGSHFTISLTVVIGACLGWLIALAAHRLAQPFTEPAEDGLPLTDHGMGINVVAACIGSVTCLALVFAFGFTLNLAFAGVFCAGLLALSLIDFQHFVLPDTLTLPLLWVGLLANTGGRFTSLADAVIGAVAGYLTLWLIYWVFKLLRNKEGLGYGDFKLTAAIGAWLGWQALPMVIFIAAVGGILAALALIISKRMQAEQPIPFGPFLAAAGCIAICTKTKGLWWLM